MANSTTNLDLVSASQAQKEVTINALLDAASPATLYGRRASATTGLTWGYYGGMILVGGTPTAVTNGTVSLADAATNYVEATAAGVVSANAVGFTAGRIPLYTVVTASGVVSSYTDNRIGNAGAEAAGTAAGLMAAHEAEVNPHPVYLTQTEADALYADTGDGDAAVAAHEAASDPHPDYLKQAEADALYCPRAPTVVPVTWAATITIDLDGHPDNTVFTCTLAGSTTIDIEGGTNKQKAMIELKQDATGGRLVALGAAFAFGADIASFTASTTAGKVDYLGVIYDSTAANYRVIATAKGY